MDLGMVGLGKMGANMTERLLESAHRVVVYDRNTEPIEQAAKRGAIGVDSVEELVSELPDPRVVWMMVPAGDPVDQTLAALRPTLGKGDIVVDGGNSFYKDTMRRARELEAAGLHYVDVGTSGGVWGLKEGYSMMVGGGSDPVETLRPALETLAPAPEKGWGHVGPSGAGHFVKMVHNGIEYGLMQAYAEGFALMKAKTEFELDVHEVAEIWRQGSVVRSWLLDLIARGLADDQTLEAVAPFVADSGEGRWTVFESIDLDVPAPVIALSLLQRLRSRDSESYADRLLAMMRNQFGGHAVEQDDQS